MEKTIPLYQNIARRIEEMIFTGVFEPGERLPSIRDLHRDFHVSVNTAREVYRVLEDRGVAEPRRQSGHFVRQVPAYCADCDMDFPDPRVAVPREATPGQDASRVLRDGFQAGWINLATAEPPSSLLPAQRLAEVTARELRRYSDRAAGYSLPPGPETLRQEVAKRVFRGGVSVSPDQILITAGCMEAVFLSLMTVCKPGDAVIVESPGFFLFYQLLDRLNLKAIEVPSRPGRGVDPVELDQVLGDAEQRRRKNNGPRVAALLLIANFSNPIGSLIPVDQKKKIAAIIERHGVILVEDDMYGEMAWDVERPPSLASFTDPDQTFLCASFSKSIAPGYRVGWVSTGSRFIDQVVHAKLVTSAGVVHPTALGVAAFLANGGYDRWLRAARRHYRESVARVRRVVVESFPVGTRTTSPAGGMVVWIVMPPEVDSRLLYQRVREHQIAFAPGPMFTLSDSYNNCLRLNATNWDDQIEQAIRKIGDTATELFEEQRNRRGGLNRDV